MALAEHYAEILADTGIADRVDPRSGGTSIADLIEAIQGRAADGLIAAVTPRRRDSRRARAAASTTMDELPNKVIMIL